MMSDFQMKDWIIYASGIQDQTIWGIEMKEGDFELYGESVLVLFKQAIVEKDFKDIGDGMKVPYLCKRDEKVYFLLSAFDSGLGIYKWFDESSWDSKTYAYWLNSSEVDYTNDLLSTLWSQATLVAWKFIEIHWLQEDKGIERLIEIISYFLWLTILYWNFTNIWQSISHAVIQLPLVGTIAAQEENILSMIEKLREHHMFMVVDYQPMKSGQVLQINIDDQEILDIWSIWLWWEKFDQTWVREKIQEFCGDWLDLDKYVLKFLRK